MASSENFAASEPFDGPIEACVDAEQNGLRLDVFLTGVLGSDFSRAGVQRLIKEGFVTRCEQPEANPAKKVRTGESYLVNVPEAVESALVPEDIPLDIVYEDDWLLVINKPVGLTVHPAPGNETGTLVHALLHHCLGDDGSSVLSGINGERRPGIVHRIDKDTSGLLVVAKDDVTHRALAGQFSRHVSHRKYFALCRGVPLPRIGRIESMIGRHPVHRKKRAVVNDGGKLAITHYKVVESFGDGAALLELMLETGRTHQIRVHLSHKGHPLLNDPLYGSSMAGGLALKGVDVASALLAAILAELPGQALHAAELGFVHPKTGEEMFFQAPLPAGFAKLLDALRAGVK